MRLMAGLVAALVCGGALADVPLIESRLTWDDPEVQAAIGARDEYAQYGDIGCFLNWEKMVAAARQSRGWDADTAEHERVRFIAAGVLAGEITFFGPDPLKTPAGFQVLRGTCGDVPERAAMDSSHAYLVENLDQIFIEAGQIVPCGGDSRDLMDALYAAPHAEKSGNVWLPMELFMVALGTEWIKGFGINSRGYPQPPLCRN